LLDELHDAARRLDDRLCTIERIMTAENPDWRQQCLPGRENSRLLANGDE
jgi:phage shock protein B